MQQQSGSGEGSGSSSFNTHGISWNLSSLQIGAGISTDTNLQVSASPALVDSIHSLIVASYFTHCYIYLMCKSFFFSFLFPAEISRLFLPYFAIFRLGRKWHHNLPLVRFSVCPKTNNIPSAVQKLALPAPKLDVTEDKKEELGMNLIPMAAILMERGNERLGDSLTSAQTLVSPCLVPDQSMLSVYVTGVHKRET